VDRHTIRELGAIMKSKNTGSAKYPLPVMKMQIFGHSQVTEAQEILELPEEKFFLFQ